MPSISVLVANTIIAGSLTCWWWVLDGAIIEHRRARAREESWAYDVLLTVGFSLVMFIWLVILIFAFLGVNYHR